MTPPLHRPLSLGLLLASLARVAPAIAQDAPPTPAPSPAPTAQPAPPPISADDLARAKRVFDAGGRSYDQGDYIAALQAFEQAYAIAPRPNILFSRAQAHRKQWLSNKNESHRARAIELYREFIATAPKGKRKAEATTNLGELDRETTAPSVPGPAPAPAPAPLAALAPKRTLLSIDSPTPGALIAIDGGAPAPPQVDAEVEPGRHQVRVTAPGYVPREVSVQAIPNETNPETIELEESPGRLAIAAPTGASVFIDGRAYGQVSALDLRPGRHFVSVTIEGRQSVAETVSLARGERRSLKFDPPLGPQRIAAWTLIAVGAGTIAGGVVALGVSAGRESQAAAIDEERTAGSIDQPRLDEYESLRLSAIDLRTAGFATLGAGGAVGLLGVTLFLVDRPSPLTPPREVDTGPRRDDQRERDDDIAWVPVLSPQVAGLWVSAAF